MAEAPAERDESREDVRWPRVWLSGASSGIGAELARQLARRGSAVVLFARRAERLEALRDEIVAAGCMDARVLVHPGDVGDKDAVRHSIAETERELGGIDLLLLNAGIGDLMSPRRFDSALVERVHRVNFLGAVYAIEAALPGMLDRRAGTIAGVSSIVSVRGLPGAAPYCSSKAAFSTFLESLRVDLRREGIRVVTVSPGFIDTPLTKRNRFPMPFLQPVDRAVARILRGIDKGKREIQFPLRFTVPMRVLGCLPGPIADGVLRLVARKRYRKEPDARG